MEERTQDIHKRIAMARLPSLPQALLRIMDLAERDDVDLSEIARLVSQDSALTAKILSTANSAYYNVGRHIQSIDQCLSLLGVGQVRRIALNHSVAELFSRFQNTRGFDMRFYWYHVLFMAIISRELARKLKYPNVEEAYLVGLLHDVGQLALLSVAADEYLPIFKAATGEQRLMEEELKVFGVAHPEIGAWLMQKWNLHGFVADALLYHHEPLERTKDAHTLVQIIVLAHAISGTCEDDDKTSADIDLDFWQLKPEEAKAIVQAAEAETREIAAALGIEISDHKEAALFAPATDDSAHAQLAAAVSSRLEAQSTLPEPSQDSTRPEAYMGILRSAKMLFSTSAAALFLQEKEVLQGHHLAGDDSRLGEIRLRLPAADSVIAQAHAGQIAVTGDGKALENLADAQVRRILGSERLVCLPLSHDGTSLGALALGLPAGAADFFLARPALMSTYAREAGRSLALALNRVDAENQAASDARQQFQLHARKVVHEANNPLGVIRNYIALLRDKLGGSAQVQKDIDLVENELRRVARILQQIKESDGLSSLGQGSHSNVNINDVISDVIRFCRLGRPELEKVKTRLELDVNLPALHLNSDKVKQVLTNLIFNAAEAMPEGGEIAISSANWQSAKGGNSVEITVKDNGPGLPEWVLERLYQPVQSKKGGPHQGLGLSIVGKLVEEMGGVLHCNSSKAGTSFKILLPANE